MIRALPLLLLVAYGVLSLWFSARQTKRRLDENSAPLDDPQIMALVQKMAAALQVPRILVHVYQIDAVNGLAAPDGRIFLTRGFVARKAAGEVSDDEIASVIAHELGHVALGHSRRRMIDFTGQNAVVVVMSVLLNRFVPFFSAWLARSVSAALMARLSRRDEFEADEWASALLIKSGIGAEPQKSLFRKLEGLTGSKSAGAPAWLMSHPRAAERIAAIERNEARWSAKTRQIPRAP